MTRVLYRTPYLWDTARTEYDDEFEAGWMRAKTHPFTGEPLRIEHLSLSPGSMVLNFDRSLLPPADFEFVVVSDTHFIRDAEAYAIEFDSVGQWPDRAAWSLRCVAELEIDLVIHLGDLCEEPPSHADHESSRESALQLMSGLGMKPHFVAGNMDIGDKPDPTMFTPPVSEATLAWFHRRFGPTWTSFDRGGCHFVLLNSQILNGVLPAAETQARWLEEDLAAHEDQRILLFLHMPPFFVAEDEPDTGFYNSIDEPARSWLTRLMRRYGVEAVFCGHTHFRALNRVDETRLHVCPSGVTVMTGGVVSANPALLTGGKTLFPADDYA